MKATSFTALVLFCVSNYALADIPNFVRIGNDGSIVTIKCKGNDCRLSAGDGSPGTPNTDLPKADFSNPNNEVTKGCNAIVKGLFGGSKSC